MINTPGDAMAAMRAELAAKDAEIERLRELCLRWNKMATHFAAGSEFINDPERVLEALLARHEGQMRLRDKYRERLREMEAALSAEKAARGEDTAKLRREANHLAAIVFCAADLLAGFQKARTPKEIRAFREECANAEAELRREAREYWAARSSSGDGGREQPQPELRAALSAAERRSRPSGRSYEIGSGERWPFEEEADRG